MPQVAGREGATITIQTTVDLSGSMLDIEDAMLASALALTKTDPPVLTGIDPLTVAGDGGMRRFQQRKNYSHFYLTMFSGSP